MDPIPTVDEFYERVAEAVAREGLTDAERLAEVMSAVRLEGHYREQRLKRVRPDLFERKLHEMAVGESGYTLHWAADGDFIKMNYPVRDEPFGTMSTPVRRTSQFVWELDGKDYFGDNPSRSLWGSLSGLFRPRDGEMKPAGLDEI